MVKRYTPEEYAAMDPFALRLHGLPLLVRLVLILPLLLPPAGILLASPYGSWLPSPDWEAASGRAATLAGVLTGAHMAAIVAYAQVAEARFRGETPLRMTTVILCLFGFFVSYIGSDLALRRVGPAIHAQLAGGEVTFAFTVIRADGPDKSMRCQTPVIVTGTTICRVPDSLRRQLRPGMTLSITGRGTWRGVFRQRLGIGP